MSLSPEITIFNFTQLENTMGTKIGKQKEAKPVAGFSTSQLQGLVERGGKDKQKAITELTKRGQPVS